MKISSIEFKNDGKIPSRFTCDGEGINPELSFSDVPKGTKSLALIIDDPDIPEASKKRLGESVFNHWVLWNIPPFDNEILEGTTPMDAVVGLNSAGKNEYASPCPPDREHRYFFRLYALDASLNLGPKTKAKDLLSIIRGHVLAQAELVGLYERK